MTQIQNEIKELKDQMLNRVHFIKSESQDYDIKSKTIERQNEIIEILIEEGGKIHNELTK